MKTTRTKRSVLGGALLAVVALGLTTGTTMVHANGTTSSPQANLDTDSGSPRTPYSWMMPAHADDTTIHGWIFIGSRQCAWSAENATGIFTGARATAIGAAALD
jgi:hypothetical protein